MLSFISLLWRVTVFARQQKPEQQSIQEIVTRYHGNMEIKKDSGFFELFLYLPL